MIADKEKQLEDWELEERLNAYYGWLGAKDVAIEVIAILIKKGAITMEDVTNYNG